MGQFLKISGFVCASALLLAGAPALAGVAGGFGGHTGGFHMARPAHGGFRPGPIYRPGMNAGYRPGYYGARRPGFNGAYRPGYYAGYRPGYYGAYGQYGLGYPYGAGFPGMNGFWPNTTGVVLAMPAPSPAPVYPVYQTYVTYPDYPLGYDGASYAPTGNGVIYNVPPTESPKIIYLSGDDKAHGAAGHHGLTIIRGGEVTTE